MTGATASNTVTLGRIWSSTTGAPGATENTTAQNAMAPQALSVAAGTTVTFTNPAGNAHSHGAASFFDHEFDSGTLAPGPSYAHTFARRASTTTTTRSSRRTPGLVTVNVSGGLRLKVPVARRKTAAAPGGPPPRAPAVRT